MNSRWQTNRIGLINFWYYDDQEFYFAKGRILLRGSNGSGKSVTMQSAIPLLLDGNMSPERLDPFGSRDRKMSSYLLEEDDEREECTGYLYLEFKRKDSDTYLTIGMGIRARKSKPLDKWYFSITDGRRIGHDFFLYKETGEKVTLSKKELEKRMEGGGIVMDRQQDYMEYVNQQIFGFASAAEYKEMLDLLIQLRTPKLSKDFKPSIINEILSDSLQPMSDDDLRPMSEAIENMDTMTMNLKSRQEAKQAAEKIWRVYEKYNQLFLYEKAFNDTVCQKEILQLGKDMDRLKKEIISSEEQIIKLEEEYHGLYAERETREKERDSLNKSDAVAIKQQEMEIEKRLLENQSALKEKEAQLADKQDKYVSIRNKCDKTGEEAESKKESLLELLAVMQDTAEDMAFQEHAFLCEELKREMDVSFSFDMHKQLTDKWISQIDRVVSLLQEENSKRRQLEERIQELDKEKKTADGVQRQVNEYGNLFQEEQNILKAAYFKWNGENRELHLSKEVLGTISKFVDGYGQDSDIAKVRGLVADVYFGRQEVIRREKDTAERLKEELTDKKRELEEELISWEKDKEPEPPRSEGVLKNRKKLNQMGIPYQEFYKMIEFSEDLTPEQCSRLEEALLSMGILDAVVVEEQYKEQVLGLDRGLCDKYLFVTGKRAEKSLLDLFDLNQSVNDIFTNQRITSILSAISYEDGTGTQDVICVGVDGRYKMGPLLGKVTGEYEACYIGTAARARARLARMEELKEQIRKLSQEKEALEKVIRDWEEKGDTLKAEYESCPGDEDIREAFHMLEASQRSLEFILDNIRKMEGKIQLISAEVKDLRMEAEQAADKVYLSCNLDIFRKAAASAKEYDRNLGILDSAHGIYLNLLRLKSDIEDQLLQLDEDMDNIRYDMGNYKRSCQRDEIQLTSLREQLQLTDYDEIQERLNDCLNWLAGFSGKTESCVRKIEEVKNTGNIYRQELDKSEKKAGNLERKGTYTGKCYQEELALGYVELPEGVRDASAVAEQLSLSASGLDKNKVNSRLNEVYFENRGFLTDYQITQTEIFGDQAEEGYPSAARLNIDARYRGVRISFKELLTYLEAEIEELRTLIRDGDRELFEDILANTISRKIRSRINSSIDWVDKMNDLMGAMNTSSGLKLSLRWRSKTAENENQLDTKELVSLLKKDYRIMKEEEADRLSAHFRSKVEEARRRAGDSGGMVSFYQVMKETLDYRKWFEFQVMSQKPGERVKELTNSVFGTFSGGEKAMSMYVPLFSAVVAKYKGGRDDAPRLISLDEAFAGVDSNNIRDMFRLMTEFEFDFIINSQVLWGDCDTVDALAIYQLIRPDNVKFVTVMTYLWNGNIREMLDHERELEGRV